MPAASTDRTTSRLRCWAVRTARKTALGLAIALVLVVFIRGTAAQTFTTPAGFMLPEIRAGSHALVWKWRSDLQPDQIIVYRDAQGRAIHSIP